MLDLSGTWSLADERRECELSAMVPGDVHSALQAAGLIPDPYQGRNEYGVRWVADREFPIAALEADEILALRWRAANGMAGGEVFTPVRWKNLTLRDPRIGVTTTTDGGTLTARLTAEAVALFATLEADRPGRFSTNAVTLFPGHPAEITFTPADGDAAGTQLTVRDLCSSFATT